MLPLYDYSPVGDRENLCRNIQKRISDGHCRIVNLLGEREQTEQRPELFGMENGIWKTRQYIGLFEYQGESLTIASRFDSENPKPFFLWYLMENFLQESMISLENISSTHHKSFLDELLAVRLAVLLQRAWKKGGLRAYNSFNRNDSKANGVPDIARHIRENLELDNGRMAYRVQAYSLDNPWNILFLQACAVARRRFPDLMRCLERRLPEFSAALRTLTQAAPNWETADLNQTMRLTQRRLTNPIYRDWESVRLAAWAVLRRMGTVPEKSSASLVTGVFLDMNQLWERLLEDKLFSGAEKPFSQQSRYVLNGHVEIRPDFYFPAQRTVLDAKNRSAWEDTLQPAWPGIHRTSGPAGKWSRQLNSPDALRDNIYQILSYMLALDCSQGGVVFPYRIRNDSIVNPVCDSIGPAGLYFWRIPVCIPKAATYGDFRDKLNKELHRLRKQAPVRQIVDYEHN